MEPEEYEKIEQYLNGELTPEDLEAFEARMSSDPEFAGVVEAYREVEHTLRARAAGEQGEADLRKTLRSVSEEHFSERGKARVIPVKPVYWAAAACLVAVLTFVVVLDWASDPSYSDYAQYDQLSLGTRSAEDDLLETQNMAEEAFNSKSFEEAAKYLEELLEEDPGGVKVKVYLAISYLEQDEFSKADRMLREVENGSSIYKYTATWYLALSYLKQERFSECKSKLEKIPERADKYEEARKLLQDLD